MPLLQFWFSLSDLEVTILPATGISALGVGTHTRFSCKTYEQHICTCSSYEQVQIAREQCALNQQLRKPVTKNKTCNPHFAVCEYYSLIASGREMHECFFSIGDMLRPAWTFTNSGIHECKRVCKTSSVAVHKRCQNAGAA